MEEEKEEGVLRCALHGHRLTLYCLDLEKLACVACRGSDKRGKHRFTTVDEAARGRRDALRESLKPLKQRAKDFADTAAAGSTSPAPIEQQRRAELRATEAGVRRETDVLFRFLRREETARVDALREEAAQKRRAMVEKGEGLSGDAAVLWDAVRSVQDQLRDADPESFLRNYRPVANGTLTMQDPRPLSPQALLDVAGHLGNLAFKDPRPLSPHALLDVAGHLGNLAFKDPRPLSPHALLDVAGHLGNLAFKDPRPLSPQALLDVAGHLGNLAFKVWLNMRDVLPGYAPVVLDPRTAAPRGGGPGLTVSRELHAIGHESGHGAPQRRPAAWHDVLGSSGLTAGSHSWAVDTGGSERWALGVLTEAYRRTGDSEQGFWELMCYDGRYVAHSSQGWSYLPVTSVRGVRLQLDGDRGALSFWDGHSNTHLHTFTRLAQVGHGGALFPSFYNGQPGAHLRLLPAKVRVTTL